MNFIISKYQVHQLNQLHQRFKQFLHYFLLLIIVSSCNDLPRNNSHPEISDISIRKGKELASLYCQSCHLPPAPSLLDSKSWEKGVLPHMGPLLGIFEFNYQHYPFNRNDRNLRKGFYPETPLVKPGEWKNILDYYIATSPDSLPKQDREFPISNDLSLFTAVSPANRYAGSLTSFVKIDTSTSIPSLVVCDLNKQTIYRFDKLLHLKDSLLTGRIVDMDFQRNKIIACNIGTFNPTNEKYGKGQTILIDSNGNMREDSTLLFNKLRRPVQITAADLNNDGKMDYVICEFGYLAGDLSWMENTGNNKFERHVLRAEPGATKAYVRDDNHDGLKDLWVLFSQGEEGIFLFRNKGNGLFEQQELLRFPPSYGSSYFELADFNKDGHPDILYTCGDNADYSSVLKPYHGVYIYINDGNNHFSQQYFFPINGCYKAIARDFDNDGDLDIAAIAFFADYKYQPEEGFVYLENTGSMKFKPYTLPIATSGRWITMDAGDLDGDGKIDIVLGNFSSGPTMMTSAVNWEKGPPFLVLKNNGR